MKNTTKNTKETSEKEKNLKVEKQVVTKEEKEQKVKKADISSNVKPLDTAKKPKKPPRAPRAPKKPKEGKKIGRPTKEEAEAKEAEKKELEEKEQAEAEAKNPILGNLQAMTNLSAELLSELCEQYLPPALTENEKMILAQAAVPLAGEKLPELSPAQVFFGAFALVMLPRAIIKIQSIKKSKQAGKVKPVKSIGVIGPEHVPPQQPTDHGPYPASDLEL